MVVSTAIFGFVLKINGTGTKSMDLFAVVTYTSTSFWTTGGVIGGIISSALHPNIEIHIRNVAANSTFSLNIILLRFSILLVKRSKTTQEFERLVF
jgi:hypothetical protein